MISGSKKNILYINIYMFLQKIFFVIRDKYSISIDEIEDLFDIGDNLN